MDATSIYTVIITILTVFGSASAWRFYEKRMSAKEKNDNLMKDDCDKRITKLEALLEKASKEKDQLRKEILDLTSQVSALSTKVDFLQKENQELRDQMSSKQIPPYQRAKKDQHKLKNQDE